MRTEPPVCCAVGESRVANSAKLSWAPDRSGATVPPKASGPVGRRLRGARFYAGRAVACIAPGARRHPTC
jgi:hypothetical protein